MDTKISATLYTSVDLVQIFLWTLTCPLKVQKCGFKHNRLIGEISLKDHYANNKRDNCHMTILNCPLRLGENH